MLRYLRIYPNDNMALSSNTIHSIKLFVIAVLALLSISLFYQIFHLINKINSISQRTLSIPNTIAANAISATSQIKPKNSTTINYNSTTINQNQTNSTTILEGGPSGSWWGTASASCNQYDIVCYLESIVGSFLKSFRIYLTSFN